jgi:predicted metal-dependent HD superfamily phosphohydrolase
MILATAHSNEPRTPDEALVLDIDLSILAADEAAFDEYDRSIRAEYQWVPESSYRQARAEILESFIQRKHIYHTALYRKRYESSARRNIERALARLRAG